MQKINIYSSHSNGGGSSLVWIELTNRLNQLGYDCTYYAPHQFHLDKCKGEILSSNINIHQNDTVVIVHNLRGFERIRAKKLILSTQEMEFCPLKTLPYQDFDVVHYVSQWQKDWHGVDYPSVVIPPFVTPIQPSEGNEKVAGILGHINAHKQVDVAISKALEDGMEKVLLFGGIGDRDYFYNAIYPLIDGEKVIYKGSYDNKQEVFNQFGVLYHFSKSETYSMVISEALSAGKKIVIPEGQTWLDYYREFDNDKILNDWVQLIGGNDE